MPTSTPDRPSRKVKARPLKTAQSAPSPEVYASDLEYVREELEWIEVRSRRVTVGQKLADRCEKRQAHGDEDENECADEDLKSLRRRLQQREEVLRAAIDFRLSFHRAHGQPLALDNLVELCGLDDFERLTLLLALAPCISVKLASVLGRLSGDHRGPTIEGVFNFAELEFPARVSRRAAFTPIGPLVARDLIDLRGRFRRDELPSEFLARDINLDRRIFGFLTGATDLWEEVVGFTSVEEPKATLSQVVLNPDDKRRILSVVENHPTYLRYRKEWGFDEAVRYGRGLMMLFHGPPGTGKTLAAHAVAHHLGKRILNVDVPAFIDAYEADRFLPRLIREARLQDAVLFFDECEALLASRRTGNRLLNVLLTEMERFEGIAIMATNAPGVIDEAVVRRVMVRVAFREPDREARAEIWQRHLPSQAPLAADVDLQRLAEKFELPGGYIKNAVLVALADAVHGGEEEPILRMEHLERAASEQVLRPGDDDEALQRPNIRLADVVLTPEAKELVEEMVAAARDRRTVMERWGVGKGSARGCGVTALFHGPPGTGKTLCAEAVAGELNRPLLVGALPSLVSKWVGETEKNMAALFKQAANRGAVLFLDEADTILPDREASGGSRHDVSMVNTLLVQLERFDGTAILATNRPAAVEPALGRRLAYLIGFPLPDAEARAAIWRRLLPASAPLESSVDFAALGNSYALSGGEIRTAALRAAFRAARENRGLRQSDLMRAASEETAKHGVGRARQVGFARGAA
jgi:SpoVK/Ycf46/Vps4 family AAA+-type ATPase